MKPRTLHYRTFAEIADEMAKKRHGGLWRAYRNDYLEALIRDHWSGRFIDNAGQSCVFDLDPRVADAPTSVTREIVWRLLGCYKPQTVCEVPEGSTPPWKTLAAAKIEEYGGGVVRGLFENLALSEADARAWMDQYDEENLPRIQFGDQHPTNSEPDPCRTGEPGRPPIMIGPLVLAEFRRRANGNDTEVKPTLEAEAKSLRDWAAEKHPKAPNLSVRTIENKIRKPYRQYRSKHPTK